MATQTSDRNTALPAEAALAETAAGLERRGFGAEVVRDQDAARRAVLARIPAGASVLDAARDRIRTHCLPLENERAMAAYGGPSRIGKILEIHQEDPGRVHVVLIRRRVGF